MFPGLRNQGTKKPRNRGLGIESHSVGSDLVIHSQPTRDRQLKVKLYVLTTAEHVAGRAGSRHLEKDEGRRTEITQTKWS